MQYPVVWPSDSIGIPDVVTRLRKRPKHRHGIVPSFLGSNVVVERNSDCPCLNREQLDNILKEFGLCAIGHERAEETAEVGGSGCCGRERDID